MESGPKPPPATLNFIGRAYHRPLGDPVKAVELIYSRHLKSDEQPYNRTIRVGPQWQKLDFGWCEPNASLIVVQCEPRSRITATKPTSGDGPRVCLGIDTGSSGVVTFSTVGAGRHVIFEPSPTTHYMIRCDGAESSKAVITAYPE